MGKNPMGQGLRYFKIIIIKIFRNNFKMTWSLERWQVAFNRSIESFLYIATTGLVTNFIICLYCTIYLCIKRRSREIPGFVFWQLGLSLTNEVMFAVQIAFIMIEKDKLDFCATWFHVTQNLIILTLILSQWVFVYQYLKVACLMPFILRRNGEDGQIA